jgi:proline dehydrogenase
LVSFWKKPLFRIAKHWIAGERYEDALARTQMSNTNRVLGIINLVGEEIMVREETTAATAQYLEILKAIDARKVQSCISIKPTQLGMGFDRKLYEDNLGSILTTAKSLGNFVWMDMEGSPYATETVDSYLEFRKKFDKVGVARRREPNPRRERHNQTMQGRLQ